MAVRAKFSIESITTHSYGGKTVKARAVGDNNPENSQFSNATPSGTLEFTLSPNIPAAEFFVPGKSYFLDFTPVEG